jgi:hypothetical protein
LISIPGSNIGSRKWCRLAASFMDSHNRSYNCRTKQPLCSNRSLLLASWIGFEPEQHSARRLQHARMISTSSPNTRNFRQPIALTTSSLPGLNLISRRFRHVMIISGRRRSPSGYQLREVHEVT